MSRDKDLDDLPRLREWQRGHLNTMTAVAQRKQEQCCPLDTNFDGNCLLHSAPGVLRQTKTNVFDMNTKCEHGYLNGSCPRDDCREGKPAKSVDPKDVYTPEVKAAMQSFTTGANRSDDSKKPDYEGFFSPLVLEAYAEYMQEHRITDTGAMRASDNWQLGMPFHKYMKSLFRHFIQLWQLHRGYTPKPESRGGKVVPVTVRSAMAGVLFNTMGYFHEYLMDPEAWEQRVISEPPDADKILASDWRKQKVA